MKTKMKEMLTLDIESLENITGGKFVTDDDKWKAWSLVSDASLYSDLDGDYVQYCLNQEMANPRLISYEEWVSEYRLDDRKYREYRWSPYKR